MNSVFSVLFLFFVDWFFSQEVVSSNVLMWLVGVFVNGIFCLERKVCIFVFVVFLIYVLWYGGIVYLLLINNVL